MSAPESKRQIVVFGLGEEADVTEGSVRWQECS
jgi:hypothetical protein